MRTTVMHHVGREDRFFGADFDGPAPFASIDCGEFSLLFDREDLPALDSLIDAACAVKKYWIQGKQPNEKESSS